MPEIQSPLIVEALLEAMETMAFITPLPAEPASPPPAEAKLLRIEFWRPEPGAIELVAPAALGRMIAANLLGADDEPGRISAEDALGELLNVTCGSLLRKHARSGGPLKMSLPEAEAFDLDLSWARFIAQPSVHVLDADGCTIAVRLIGME